MNYTLVTGACGGLGGAFVRTLAEKGNALYLTGRSEERLKKRCESLKDEFPAVEIKYRACDLSDIDDRHAFFEALDAEEVRLSRLVYVAGVDTQKAFEKYSEEAMLFQMRVNFEAAVSFIRASLQRGRLDGSFEVLVVGSMSGNCPMPYFALYSATKRALWQFCVALHDEMLGKAKITCVLPGGIPTREDIKQDIERRGFWAKLSAKSPRSVAIASLKAVKRNRRSKVIGFWNNIITWVTRMTPLPLQLRYVKKHWAGSEKDAFAKSKEKEEFPMLDAEGALSNDQPVTYVPNTLYAVNEETENEQEETPAEAMEEEQ